MTAGHDSYQISSPVPGDGNVQRPLRIVHYIPAIRMEQGGVVRAILDWCTVFARRGHRVTLIAYEVNDVPEPWLAEQEHNPRALAIPAPWLPGNLLGRAAMRAVDSALADADVLHLHGPWLNGNFQVASLARRRGVPYLVSTHGMLGDWGMIRRGLKKKLYLKMFGKPVLDAAVVIHCTAEAEWAEASKWFSNPGKAILPYLVDLSPFDALPGPQAGLELLPGNQRHRPKLLFVGRLHEQKGLDILIRAAALLRDQGIDFVLIVAGAGETPYANQLRDLVAQMQLHDRVLFLGLVTGQKKISLYQAADLFILPTRHENFGLVLIEALASGTPVLTTKGTNIWREVEAAGGVIAECTPPGLADAIKGMLANFGALSARGERGRAWAMETFSEQPLARRYEELYRRVAGPTRPAEGKS